MLGLLALTATLSGCALVGIEPDEIDVADEGTGGLSGDGDGDGDPTTGDPNGDTGEADSTGEGDPSSACDDLGPLPIVAGQNPIELPTEPNDFAGTCGGADGPDLLLSFTASADGPHGFTLVEPEFDGVIYLLGDQCQPPVEVACDPQTVEVDLLAGETIYIVVDSNQANVGGLATVVVTGQ